MFRQSRRRLCAMSAVCILATAFGLAAPAALAQDGATITGRVQPGIWIDPDGCMHWVADGGIEGYMEGRVDPHTGRPVCLSMNTCAIANSDQLFAGDSATLTASGQAHLQQFFRSTGAFAYGVYGHTDNRASDRQSLRLSERRAAAVADVARGLGVRIAREIGYGARRPVVPNDSAANMQRNRRVEIVCYR